MLSPDVVWLSWKVPPLNPGAVGTAPEMSSLQGSRTFIANRAPSDGAGRAQKSLRYSRAKLLRLVCRLGNKSENQECLRILFSATRPYSPQFRPPPPKAFQAFERPVFRGESQGDRPLVLEPARQADGAARRREDANPSP